ncbi:MAG: response regulator [Gemmatimonadota bacterium]|nr:response regulator [Gemmatimonadota bacterium]
MPARVLLLESSPELRKVLEESLGQHGYTVVSATSTEEALDRLCEHAADLVIADPPAERGEDAGTVERIHEAFPGLPSIVMSRERFDPSVLAPASTDVVPRRVLRKPFRLDELLVLTRQILPTNEPPPHAPD